MTHHDDHSHDSHAHGADVPADAIPENSWQDKALMLLAGVALIGLLVTGYAWSTITLDQAGEHGEHEQTESH